MASRTTALFTTLALLTACCNAREISSAAGQLQTLSRDFWMFLVEELPAFGTWTGTHAFNSKYESFTMNDFDRRYAKCRDFLTRLNAIDLTSLAEEDHVNLEVLRDLLRMYTTGYKWRYYGASNPMNFLEGMQRYFAPTISSTPFATYNDYTDYLARLAGISVQVDQQMALMRESMRRNTTNHARSMIGVVEQINGNLVDVKRTAFFKPFLIDLQKTNISDVRKSELMRRGEDVIRNTIQPALSRYIRFIQKEYRTRAEIGVSSLPAGLEYYRAALRLYLGEDWSPADIHQLGRREVERIKARMEEVMKRVGYEGDDLPSFLAYLKTQERFFNHTEESLIAQYTQIIDDRINPKLLQFFKTLPKLPVRVVQMAYDGPSAYYQLRKDEYGMFVLNTRRPKTRASFFMVALALHEANPGHHFQISGASMLPLPEFRRNPVGRKYTVPFEFPSYTAFIEGWGLYSEYLGEEMGLFEDPYDLFGRYSSEIFRACRLVVDSGIHAFGWSAEKAVDYFANHTTLSRQQLETEVNRYITWPGQATTYKIGEIKIKGIRQKAEQKLGVKFDVKEFHDQVLKNAAVPLSIVERTVDSWIAQTLNSSSSARTVHAHMWIIPAIFIFSIIGFLV